MKLQDIYMMHPEHAEYDYEKFSSRVSAVRKVIKDSKHRETEDQIAFDNYRSNHPPSFFSHRGYIEWQGSEAQDYLHLDMEAKLHISMEEKDLWASRPQYYESFPLDVFRDKVYQEQRTKKFLHTLNEKGQLHKSS